MNPEADHISLEETFPKTLCCVCGRILFKPQLNNICSLCLRQTINLGAGIARSGTIKSCRDCGRYEKPPFVHAEWESPELLHMCLKKIRGLEGLIIRDAKLLFTIRTSKRIRIEVTLGSVKSDSLQEVILVEVVIIEMQCNDCKRTYTPHLWGAGVQLRQKGISRCNLDSIENSIITDGIQNIICDVKQEEKGLDFSFIDRSTAVRFQEFVADRMVCRSKASKHLISHDTHNATYNYKYEFVVELCSVSPNDLVILPMAIRRSLGGTGCLQLVSKVTTSIHIIDVFSGCKSMISNSEYWKNAFLSVCSPQNATLYTVVEVEDVTCSVRNPGKTETYTSSVKRRNSAMISVYLFNETCGDMPVHARTAIPLRAGDTVYCCDLNRRNLSGLEDTSLDIEKMSFTVIPMKKQNAKERVKTDKPTVECSSVVSLDYSEITTPRADYEKLQTPYHSISSLDSLSSNSLEPNECKSSIGLTREDENQPEFVDIVTLMKAVRMD